MDFAQVTPRQLGAGGAAPAPGPRTAQFGGTVGGCLRCARSALVEVAWVVALVLGRGVVWAINAWLDYWAPPYQLNVQLAGTSRVGGKLATDGVSPPGHGVRATLFEAAYGPHPKETLDTLRCEDRSLAGGRPGIVYAHGGGWIAANSACLLHSVAPISRAGFDVYSLDYPLAPMVRFPDPVVSILRALAWIKRHEGHGEVILFGDSAGGNLVTMAAAMVCNRPLLKQLARETGLPLLLELDLPRIRAVASMYGVMDQHAWRQDLESISFLENKIAHFCIAFAFRLYRCPKSRFANRLTLVDILDEVEHLPPLHMQCGSKDVLAASNRRLFTELSRRRHAAQYLEYEARHCFFGFPPHWLSAQTWASGSRRALTDLLVFLVAASDSDQHQHQQ